MKKILSIIFIGVIMMSIFSACGMGPKYKLDFGTSDQFFEGAKSSYHKGEKVKFYFDEIATDTDYTFYVDGKSFNPDYSDKKGYIFEFTMPDHDVKVEFTHRNSMLMYTDEEE